MRCSYCGREFKEETSQKQCRCCSAFGGCKMVKCPYCGYEIPRETDLVKKIKNWRQKKDD